MLRRPGQVGMFLSLWFLPVMAGAELLRFDAVLETRVQEFVAGQPLSFDQAFEEFEVTSAELPLGVAANLVSPGAIDTLAAQGRGLADFFEPRIAPGENPAELALEADCVSLDSNISYQVTASTVETRTISFTRLELAPAGNADREVESSIFLSGAVFVWSQEPGMDLTGLDGEMLLTVEQIRSLEDAEGEEPVEETKTVFSTSIGVRGGPHGALEPLAEGGVSFVFGGPEILLDAVGSDSALDRYLDVMGTVRVLLVPEQEFRYRYHAVAEEEFRLQAAMSVEVANLPDGTGVSAVFGRPFDSLADMIDAAFLDVEGKTIQSAVNLAQAKAQAPTGPHPPGAARAAAAPPARLCGTMGAGGVALLLLLSAGAKLNAHRRRR